MFKRLAILALLFSTASHANLIVNGDFDSQDKGLRAAKASKSWDIFSNIAGWETTSGAGIEVGQFRHYTKQAAPGQIDKWVVELDSRNNSSMVQYIDVAESGWYDFSFWYAPRTNRKNDNIVTASMSDFGELVTFNETKKSQKGWQQFTTQLWLDSKEYMLSLAAGGRSNSYGGVVDGFSLTQSIPVPAPATLGLFGLALAFIGLRRKA